ncbi:MAG TPA: hypothetical protein DIW81_24600 [Planctomycetaceae bacterium]|nr:hypothetical protein [Planctomycetaceae bacterium]
MTHPISGQQNPDCPLGIPAGVAFLDVIDATDIRQQRAAVGKYPRFDGESVRDRCPLAFFRNQYDTR